MKKIMSALTALLVLAVGVSLSACSSESEQPQKMMNGAWVRTTDGAENKKMTGLFGDIVNPTDKSVTLISADCGDIAGKIEIHEMVKVEGKMMMQEAKDGAVVPAGSHLHLAPNGYHVMLMKLNQELPIGDEVTCTLKFDDDSSLEVTAPVKKFTEEEAEYHTHAASDD